MLTLLNSLRTSRFTAIAVSIAAFAQLAMITHNVVVEHSPSEQCEICIAQDRSDDLIVSADITLPLVTTSISGSVTAAYPLASVAGAAVRNRGPPLL
jgi:hypothetical protein